MTNLLVKLIGFPATLIHADLLVLDRWRWLKRHLKDTKRGNLIDIGCGSGAFSLGAARMGFDVLGLSWDEANQNKAMERARILGLEDRAKFEIVDVRFLDLKREYDNRFDTAVCTENIEHIINDQKLMRDMANVLKTNGLLLLTTPNYDYVPMGGDAKSDITPVEDGGHVRVGYLPLDLVRLCEGSGFRVVAIDYCSGFFSQKVTSLFRVLTRFFNYRLAWLIILPFRVLPLLLDRAIEAVFKWPGYSICLVAEKKIQGNG